MMLLTQGEQNDLLCTSHIHAGDLFAGTVLVVDREHPLALLLRELIQTRVIRIIHVVVDAVDTGLVWARIRRCRAAFSCSGLGRSVGDVIALACAGGALEDVEETEPVTAFVHGGEAEIVVINFLRTMSAVCLSNLDVRLAYINSGH